jgi:type III pantothenate kinase
MLLCLDIGNSHLCGGVFNRNELLLQFRYDSKQIGTSDQLGVFIRSVLRENEIDYHQLKKIGIASVVPSAEYSVRAACIKYLQIEPLILRPDVKTGIQIKTNNPNEVGADLIAGSIAAKKLYPNYEVLIFDFGTATTCSYVNKVGDFVGAVIAPGIRLMMESLQSNTAKLFGVDIIEPRSVVGKNSKTAIQSGIYYAQLGLVDQLIKHIIIEYKLTAQPIIIATGGFSHMFATSKIFDKLIPELILLGVKQMLELNCI